MSETMPGSGEGKGENEKYLVGNLVWLSDWKIRSNYET